MSNANEQLKLNMTVAEAIEFAEEWSKNCTFHAESQGWRVVCMILAAEVKRQRQYIADIESNLCSALDTVDALSFAAPVDHSKDAERYRWLFHDGDDCMLRINHCYRYWNGEGGFSGLERVIDAAIMIYTIAQEKAE